MSRTFMYRSRSRLFTLRLASAAVLALIALFAPPAQATLRAVPLEAPASEATVDASPTFTWRGVKGAGSYEFQLSSDRLFGSINQVIKTLNTAATLKGTLTDGTYFWRVRAISPANKAGRWSTVRTLDKHWRTGPELLEPNVDFGAVWPSLPLVMKWSAIPHATDYKVVVATDPSLAQPVLGSVAKPATTQGTVLAFPGTLNAGTYYWQITPLDGEGHSGMPSPVGRFTWTWPSALTVGVEDRNPAREVFDPLLTWNDLPGAGRYEVEVNTTEEFAPGSRVDGTTMVGTGWSPTVPLPNNTYFFRVRAIDAAGRAGGYAVGSFKKQFDDVVPDPTVANLRLNNGATPVATPALATDPPPDSTDPMFTWDPVPGAASYEIAVSPIGSTPTSQCDWTTGGAFGSPTVRSIVVDGPYADLVQVTVGPNPGEGTADKQLHTMGANQRYCVRVRAIDGAGRVSEWTYFRGADNTPAFRYTPPTAVTPGTCDDPALPQPTYMTPAPGSVSTRSPKFHWSAVPGAASYFVVLSRNQALTNIVDIAFTDRTTWVPRGTIADETTGYYWAVWPSRLPGGNCPARSADISVYPRFDKESVPPVLQAPDADATLATQPVFRWDGAEGAKDYRIQVARDAEFRDVIDNTVTASTVYASDDTYPVDTQLYWRVRARDANGIELAYSPARVFRRTLPTPVVDADNPTAGSTIPVLTWQSVAGATSYGFHVDKVDGKGLDFTVATPRATPTEFYGNGTWRWKVRANFPSSKSEISGPYSESHDYVRRILAPSNPRAVNTSSRIVFSWNPDPSGKKYRLEVAKDDSFTDKIETVITPNTSYAPTLGRGYGDGGKFYWRVAIQDAGNNLGAFARGDLRRAARLILTTPARRLRKHMVQTVVVTVTDPRGTKMRGARVVVSGAGAKGSKRTGKKGTVALRVLATRHGTVKFTASRKGYVTGVLTLPAY